MLHGMGSGIAYSRVVRFRYGADVPPGTFIVEPDLAAAMPEQPDKTTYIFKLRPEAKWQNIDPMNGRALKSEDLRFSYQRQIDLKTNGAYLGDTWETFDPAAPSPEG